MVYPQTDKTNKLSLTDVRDYTASIPPLDGTVKSTSAPPPPPGDCLCPSCVLCRDVRLCVRCRREWGRGWGSGRGQAVPIPIRIPIYILMPTPIPICTPMAISIYCPINIPIHHTHICIHNNIPIPIPIPMHIPTPIHIAISMHTPIPAHIHIHICVSVPWPHHSPHSSAEDPTKELEPPSQERHDLVSPRVGSISLDGIGHPAPSGAPADSFEDLPPLATVDDRVQHQFVDCRPILGITWTDYYARIFVRPGSLMSLVRFEEGPLRYA